MKRLRTLLEEQCKGGFRHGIRSGGLGGIGRAVVRLNDRAIDPSQQMTALPAAAQRQISWLREAAIDKGQAIHFRTINRKPTKL